MEYSTLKKIQDAMELIRKGALDELEPGRHDLPDGAFVNVSEYQTVESSVFEAHRKYIDIHYLIAGEELIEIADADTMRIQRDYDETADSVLGDAKGKRYLLKKGQTMVLFPEEAHMPGICNGESVRVRKAVVKIQISDSMQ